MSDPFLIVGQGLAGTAVAWRLHERGVPFLIVDRDEPLTSSKVAAGLMTPITGMRLNLNWRYDTLYPEALAFYRTRQQQLGTRFFFPRQLIRYFRDEAARKLFERRMEDDGLSAFVIGAAPQTSVCASEFGGFVQRHAAYLDTACYLEASRAFFKQMDAWEEGEIDSEDIKCSGSGVDWHGRPFRALIHCTGWQAVQSGWFDWVPFTSARGTIFEIEADLADSRSILNRGVWILPRADGTLRAGATYEPHFVHPNEPDAAALDGLRGRLGSFLKSGFREISHQTAVRPLVGRLNALMGRHPGHESIFFLNALGSKGTLRAPWAARHLVEHMLDGRPLEADVDLQQNLP